MLDILTNPENLKARIADTESRIKMRVEALDNANINYEFSKTNVNKYNVEDCARRLAEGLNLLAVLNARLGISLAKQETAETVMRFLD